MGLKPGEEVEEEVDGAHLRLALVRCQRLHLPTQGPSRIKYPRFLKNDQNGLLAGLHLQGERESVCVCARERKRDRERRTCVWLSSAPSASIYQERERERERERESGCARERERESRTARERSGGATTSAASVARPGSCSTLLVSQPPWGPEAGLSAR